MSLPPLRPPLAAVLLSLAAATLAATPLAAADRHNLYRYNGWTVDLVVREDASMACVAGTHNEKDEVLAIRVAPTSGISVHLVFRNPRSGVMPLNLAIHGVKDWTFNDFDSFFYGGSFTFWNETAAQNFLQDLARGRALSVSSPASQRISTRFLIEGAAPALDALAECTALIRGPGV